MKMPKDFDKSVTALAEEIPREVVANLLERLMPREPVRTREPQFTDEYPQSVQPDLFRAKRAVTRRRSIKDRDYVVLVKGALYNHRRASWTREMVRVALEHTNTVQAQMALDAECPIYGGKLIDWNWLAHDTHYIEFQN